MIPKRDSFARRRAPAKAEAPLPHESSSARRTGFKVFALSLPFLLVGLVELGLRLANYGYPTSFFLRAETNGTAVLVENPRFGWRFFPPSAARAPLALQFEAKKPAKAIRIFLFGGSAAMGDPEPAYGCARQLECILQARHPEHRIEVVNTAMTAINSHVIREIARDCGRGEGDLWIIFAGNNEVVGPFGAGTVFGPQAPPEQAVRLILAAKTFRLGQWISTLRTSAQEPGQWEGMEFFLHNQLSFTDPRLARVYGNFADNLDSVIRLARGAGAKVLLTSVPVNLRDCPPFASAHSRRMSAGDQKAWEERFASGQQAESKENYAEALTFYKTAETLDPHFAELAFRIAGCESKLGRREEAMADFERAKDLDTLRFRADSRIEEVIRRAASSGHVPLVDTADELARQASGGIPGNDYFYDHVHLNFSGNYLVAALLARQIERELLLATNSTGDWIAQSEVEQRLAFTSFDQRRILQEMRARLQQPPFSGQSDAQARDARLRQLLDAPQPGPADSLSQYTAALEQAPADWVLRGNYSRLLEETGQKAAAKEQWTRVAAELPNEPEAYFHLGNLLYDSGAYASAEEMLRRALEKRPGATETMNSLGLALVAEDRIQEAAAQFQKVLKLNPRFVPARINLASLQANSGSAEMAINEYREVLRLDTNNVAARINLGKLFIRQGNTNEAIRLYEEALGIKPDNAIAQFDLANAYSAQNRQAEALSHYAAAVACQPEFGDGQYNLALELARTGKLADALPHFQAAARLKPASADAHFNYGVALAKLRRYSEAAEQFNQTLKLQPDYASARDFLNRVNQLKSKTLQP